MKRNLSISMILLWACTLVYGQGEMDAYRMSRNDLSGTARSMGMAGAFGALGGDVTGVSINPGGIGVYRSSEIVATMNFSSTFSSANLDGTKSDASKFKFNFDNLAFVGYAPLGGNVRSFNYGFSFNRLKNFDRTYTARGNMQPSSLTHYIADKTTIGDYDPDKLSSYDSEERFDPWPYEQGYQWLSILGYNGALIYPNEKKDDYGRFAYHSPLRNGEKVNNVLNVTEKGAIDSYDFTGGVNVNDKLYLGLTMAFTDIGYTYSSRYTENFEQGNGFDLDNSLSTDGSGYQVSVGAIYRPVDALRLGVAYHSPTWYNMTDYVYAETFNDYDDQDPPWRNAATPKAAVSYKFNTPYRWVFSAAGVIGSSVIISADYELTDYSGMSLKDRDGFDTQWKANEFIKQDFRMASMLKTGIEYRVTPQTSVRAGYAWQQSPLQTDFRDGKIEVVTEGTIPNFTLDGDAHYVTLGLGCKITRNFYVDAAFVYRTQKDNLYFYSKVVEDAEAGDIITYHSNPAGFTNETYKGVLTLGYKF